MRTIAQKYIEEGEQICLAKGIKKIASNIIAKGLDHKLIAQVIGLKLEEINKLRKI